MEEKMLEATKGNPAKRSPFGGVISYNNDPSKPIQGEGNVPMSYISTNSGQVGQQIANLPTHLEYINRLIESKEVQARPEVKKNLENFRKNLTDASNMTGLAQLKKIANTYEGFLGSKASGASYNQAVWNALYTMLTGQQVSGSVPPQQVTAYINNSLISPINSIYNSITKNPNSRIAINNSLLPSKDVVNGMNFLSPSGLSILTDDHIILGSPAEKIDPSTGIPVPKTGTRQELESSQNNASQNDLGTTGS